MVTQLLYGLPLPLAMCCAMSMPSPCLCLSVCLPTKWVQGAHLGLQQGPREVTSICGQRLAPGSPVPGLGLPVISRVSQAGENAKRGHQGWQLPLRSYLRTLSSPQVLSMF